MIYSTNSLYPSICFLCIYDHADVSFIYLNDIKLILKYSLNWIKQKTGKQALTIIQQTVSFFHLESSQHNFTNYETRIRSFKMTIFLTWYTRKMSWNYPRYIIRSLMNDTIDFPKVVVDNRWCDTLELAQSNVNFLFRAKPTRTH